MPDRIPTYYTDPFTLPLPPGHRFPMGKYRRIRERLAAGSFADRLDFHLPPAATNAELSTVHDLDYIGRVTRGQLTERELVRLGFPWSPQLAERSRRSVGATLSAAHHALSAGLGISLAGGTHHARAAAGHGYCVFNDAAVAIAVLCGEGAIRNAAVLDLDVHQGNGTAQLSADRPEVRTISVNEAPAAGRYAYPSDLDIDLPRGTGDAEYLDAVQMALDELERNFAPDLVVYIAGADPFAGDILGQLSVTADGLRQRDLMVFSRCLDRCLPVAVTMGGGYMPDVDAIAAIHATTVETGLSCLEKLSRV